MGLLAGLFGRRSETEAVVAALHSMGRCAIVGTGGVGKSALARVVAERFASQTPVRWIDAEAHEHVDGVLRALLAETSVVVLPGERPGPLVTASFADTTALIVIDGAERFASELAALADHWTTRPDGPLLLVTSRVALGHAVLPVVRLAPLDCGDERVDGSAAAEMMRACVDALGGDSSALKQSSTRFAALVESTGGLPLAIELVATHVARFGIEFLTGRTPGIDDVIEQCVDRTLALVDVDDVDLFRRLGLSAGPMSITFVSGLAHAPIDEVLTRLAPLVDHGLVQPVGGRFDLLAPVRDVARRQLRRSGAYDSSTSALARWVFEMAGGRDHRESSTSRRFALEELDQIVHLAWMAAVDGRRSEALDLVDVLFTPLAERLRGHETLALLEAVFDGDDADAIDPEREAMSALRAAICASECDNLAHGERWLDRAEHAAERTPRPDRLLAHIWSIRAFVALDQGHLAMAHHHASRSIEAAERTGEEFMRHQSLRCRALCALALGDLDHAEDLCREVLGWGRLYDRYTEHTARLALGWCALECGRRSEVATQARALHHELQALGEHQRELQIEAELLLLAAEPPSDPIAAVDPSEERTDISNWALRLERRLRFAAGGAMVASPQEVVQTAGDVVVLADLVPLARIRIEAHLLLGEVSLAIGDRRQAILAFEQALRDSARGPYRLRCADALDGLATAAERGEGAAASSAARALATSIRARCGAVRWLHTTSDSHLRPAPTRATHPANWLHDGTPTAAGIDELMSTIRLPPTGTPIDSLTRAERQIAELVATGLTNTDIATRLFISRRTVETHLTHIYRKLDIRTRTQLAALQLRGGQ